MLPNAAWKISISTGTTSTQDEILSQWESAGTTAIQSDTNVNTETKNITHPFSSSYSPLPCITKNEFKEVDLFLSSSVHTEHRLRWTLISDSTVLGQMEAASADLRYPTLPSCNFNLPSSCLKGVSAQSFLFLESRGMIQSHRIVWGLQL